MTNPIIKIHNVTTDEVIVRPMNAAEFKAYEAKQLANAELKAAEQAEAEAAATAKAALLAKLGITADEAKLLLS